MLVLTRRLNEGAVIHLNGEIVGEITLIQVKGKQCRLGFKCDLAYEIDRKEVYEERVEEGHFNYEKKETTL